MTQNKAKQEEGELLEEAPEVMWLALSGETEWLCQGDSSCDWAEVSTPAGDLGVGQRSPLDKPQSEYLRPLEMVALEDWDDCRVSSVTEVPLSS